MPHSMTQIFRFVALGLVSCMALSIGAAVEVGSGESCVVDPQCFNRVHPNIPIVATADPGEIVTFRVRNASDVELGPGRAPSHEMSLIHPVTGPVAIRGAVKGDVLAVTILDVEPIGYGQTEVAPPAGFASDMGFESFAVVWKLAPDFATSDALPGVRIPNRGFPGILMTLPDPAAHTLVVAREMELLAAGGGVAPPDSENASPSDICGASSPTAQECLRTFPPREHGGNLDIRYISSGATIYLPCNVEGCGLAIGDTHYAQGDGEVSVTAIEMDARVTVRANIVKGKTLNRGPHYSGPAQLLDIPSSRFYATTGFPIKPKGFVPPWMEYLDADERIAGLTNLSNDIALAARNALAEMIDYLVETRGLTREQAYVLCSVAVDLRIGQLVDAPNVGVTAILPLDIFTN
jgi:formamidase